MPVNTERNPKTANTPGDLGLAIGRRLAERRSQVDLNQAQFAEKAKLSQSTLSLYERGLVPKAWLTLRTMIEAGLIDSNWLLTGRKRNGR